MPIIVVPLAASACQSNNHDPCRGVRAGAATGGVRLWVVWTGPAARVRIAAAGARVNDEFGAKLGFVLKFLTLSSGCVAAELAVDKSLVERWVAGTVHPSAHNLGRLTEFLARRVPGVTLLDWDRSVEALRDRFGGSGLPPQVTPTVVADWLAHPKVAEVAAATAIDGMKVTGFWRTTRAAPDMPGRFCHDYGMIAPRSDGPLYCESGVFSSRLSGWGMIAGDQNYSCSSSHALGSMTFGIFNRVRAARIDAIDGISLACSPARQSAAAFRLP